MTVKEKEAMVLDAIRATQPTAYAISILAYLNKDRKQGWLTRRFPVLEVIGRPCPGFLYPILSRLERRGVITSEWSTETFPERGNLRRRYYFTIRTPRPETHRPSD